MSGTSEKSGRKKVDPSIPDTFNSNVDATLTDMYQISMAYAYWDCGKKDDMSVFDAFYRKCPFKGQFCIAAGIQEVLRFINSFGFTSDQIEYLKTQLPDARPEFFDYLATLDASNVQIWAAQEGDIIFPRVPIVCVVAPLIVSQLVETTILNLLNFPSLIATNAARHRKAAFDAVRGHKPVLLEFGLRRAQGPDGALSASRYAYLGGFDGSSNVKAGHMFGLPINGTHAHAFVTSFHGFEDLEREPKQSPALGKLDDFVGRAIEYRSKVPNAWNSHPGELVAFIRYAQAFPKYMLSLVDTYETLLSGIPNFLSVALALEDAGFQAVGIRLDSGDLGYLSLQVRKLFEEAAVQFDKPHFADFKIAASNDINETVLKALNEQGHSIDVYGIGTNLVTCQQQPALGMVYKLVQLNGRPCMKLSEIPEKVSLPKKKQVYRLYSKEGSPILDLITSDQEPAPIAGEKIFCRDLFDDTKRANVTPSKVEPLLHLMFDGKNGIPKQWNKTLVESRDFCMSRLNSLRVDHLRSINPTPFKVSASNEYYEFFKETWQKTAPVPDLA